MKEPVYYNRKKIFADVLCGVILLLATKIPALVFDRMLPSPGGSYELLYTAQYILTCLFWFAFAVFAASRVPKILSGNYRDE